MENLYKYLKNVPTMNPNVAVSLAIADASDDTEDATATAEDIKEGKTAYVASGKVTGTLKELDTSDATAVVGDILSGKTAYVNGVKVTGNIQSLESKTYIPASSPQVIEAGKYLAGAQTIEAVPTEEKEVDPGASSKEVSPSIGKFLSKVTVNGDANLVAGNIKKDVSIFGVTGTYEATSTGIDTSDATATADQILEGATAYVKGQKITGTHICAPTTVTAVYKGKVKDTSDITLQTDYRTAIMSNNFEFEGYTLAEGDVIMFTDNIWISATVAIGGVVICNHSSSDEYALKGKECYVMSKAQVIQE